MKPNVNFSVWKECVRNRRLFALTTIMAVICACIVSASIPTSYASRARISIDTNDKNPLEYGNGLQYALKELLNHSESNVLTEAQVYIKILEADVFVNSLQTANIVTSDNKKMNFGHYLATREQKPWWSINEKNIINQINDRIKYELNLHNNTITIQVELQDAVVACAMVDTVIGRLHAFMTAYMVKKATIDYRHKLAERKKVEAEYQQAIHRAAQFADSNFDLERPEVAQYLKTFQDEENRLMEIRNEVNMKAMMAKMEMERTRPTFIKIVNNQVPISPLHPHWVANIFIWLFYSLFITLIYVLYRKKFELWRMK